MAGLKLSLQRVQISEPVLKDVWADPSYAEKIFNDLVMGRLDQTYAKQLVQRTEDALSRPTEIDVRAFKDDETRVQKVQEDLRRLKEQKMTPKERETFLASNLRDAISVRTGIQYINFVRSAALLALAEGAEGFDESFDEMVQNISYAAAYGESVGSMSCAAKMFYFHLQSTSYARFGRRKEGLEGLRHEVLTLANYSLDDEQYDSTIRADIARAKWIAAQSTLCISLSSSERALFLLQAYPYFKAQLPSDSKDPQAADVAHLRAFHKHFVSLAAKALKDQPALLDYISMRFDEDSRSKRSEMMRAWDAAGRREVQKVLQDDPTLSDSERRSFRVELGVAVTTHCSAALAGAKAARQKDPERLIPVNAHLEEVCILPPKTAVVLQTVLATIHDSSDEDPSLRSQSSSDFEEEVWTDDEFSTA